MRIRKIYGFDKIAVDHLMVHDFDDDGGCSINAWNFNRSAEPAHETGWGADKILVGMRELLVSARLVGHSAL